MLAKRVIPCLDVDKGKVVKGVNFIDVKSAGDPVKLAKLYNDQGADELVFLDITASYEKRDTMLNIVNQVAKNVFIPFTVGGGIKSVKDIQKILSAGADKVSLNTAAFKTPKLIKKAANTFGSQCIMVAIDAKKVDTNRFNVYINGGRTDTDISAIEWAKTATKLGAGEVLLTSIDRDGTKQGYDIELTKAVSKNVSVPVIASGGAGKLSDFFEIFDRGYADAALAASLFHFKELTIRELKYYLQKNKIPIRN